MISYTQQDAKTQGKKKIIIIIFSLRKGHKIVQFVGEVATSRNITGSVSKELIGYSNSPNKSRSIIDTGVYSVSNTI
jgi:hypothetical protein